MRALLIVALVMGAHVASAEAASNLAVQAPAELFAAQGRPAFLVVRVAIEGALGAPVTWATWVDGEPYQQGLLGDAPPGDTGASTRLEIVPLPALSLGEHDVRFVVDVHGNLSESDEADNEGTTVVHVEEAADLVIRSMGVAKTQTQWGEADPLGRQTIDVELCNDGAPSTRARMWLYMAEPDADPLDHGSWLATLDAPALATGACALVRHEFEAWGTVGEFSVQALVDAANEGNPRGNVASARGARFVEGHGRLAGAHGEAPGSAVVRALESDAPATSAVHTVEDVLCARLVAACPQLHGDYGIAGNQACRRPYPGPHLTSDAVYAAAHPDDTAPIRTGVRPCDEPTPSARAHEAAAAVDAALSRAA